MREDVAVVAAALAAALAVLGLAAGVWVRVQQSPGAESVTETGGPDVRPGGATPRDGAIPVPQWPAEEPVFVVLSSGGDAIPGSREQFLIFRWDEVAGAAGYVLSADLDGVPLGSFDVDLNAFQLDVEALRGTVCGQVAAVGPDGQMGRFSEQHCQPVNGPRPYDAPRWADKPIDVTTGGLGRSLTLAWLDVGFGASYRANLTLDGAPLGSPRLFPPGTSTADIAVPDDTTGRLCVTLSAFSDSIPESAPSAVVCQVVP